MKEHYQQIRQLGKVVAVSFAPPSAIALYLEEAPAPFPVVSDPDRIAYQVFGLGRTSWGAFFRAGVLGRYLRLMFRGWLPRRSGKEDLLQLGGDLVLDDEHRLVYAHRSAEPTDRPALADLLEALRTARSTTPPPRSP